MDYSRFRPIGTSLVPKDIYRSSEPKQKVIRPFAEHLQSAIQEGGKLVISKHAEERLQQRNIHINSESWAKIEEKISEAKKMGVNDSLVLLPDAALIVSARNQTVITALNREEAAAKIFTNINGTIVLES